MNGIEIQEKIMNLPEEIQAEVLDFIEFLLARRYRPAKRAMQFKFDWEGALSVIKEKFTSVELQHRAAEWR